MRPGPLINVLSIIDSLTASDLKKGAKLLADMGGITYAVQFLSYSDKGDNMWRFS